MESAVDINEIERITSRVEGWLTGVEGRLLYELARRADPAGAIVEIGSWKGRSTVWLAAGAKAGRGARVVAIDPHKATALHAEGEDTEQTLRRNLELAGVSDQVDVVVATSEDVADGWRRPVALLWIDGDHEYESVKRDFLLWERHVVDGGVVALHDTLFWDGPGQVVSEFIERLRRYTSIGYAHTITHATRQNRPTGRQLLRKRLEIAGRRFYGVRERAYADNTFRYADALDGLRGLAREIRRRANEEP